MRELQARLSGLDSGRREVAGRPAGALGGADGGLRWRSTMGPGGKMRTEDTEGTARGPGWREFAGTLGCAVGSSVADGAVRPGVEWLAVGPGRD